MPADTRDPSAKRATCKKCSTVLILGLTAKVRNRRKLPFSDCLLVLIISKSISYERVAHDLPLLQHAVDGTNATNFDLGR